MILKTLFLCDAATAHPDNTFSVLRGGIDRVTIPISKSADGRVTQPAVKVSLVAILELERTEMERLHNLQLSFLDTDGKRVLPDLMSNFQTPATSEVWRRRHSVILDVLVPRLESGEYAFYVNVDGHELGSHPFYVIQSHTK